MQPVSETFREQVRGRALKVARHLTVERGWQQVRFVDVADAVGVSRPTMYSEFGNKAGLGEALVLSETNNFLTGLIHEVESHTGDLTGAANAALRYTVLMASENPLLHGVLTNAGDSGLLLLLTSESGPVLPIAVEVLSGWFTEHFPEVDAVRLTELTEALVRLTLSHLVQPTRTVEQTIAVLERFTDLVVPAMLRQG